MNDSYEKIFKEKSRIMTVFSHPDDLEIYCGGTVARLTADGKTVRAVKMTSGNKGSRQEKISAKKLRSVREKEDSLAMKILGVKKEDNVFLNISDGEIENDLKTIGLIAQQIRSFQPDIIITHNPENVVIRYDKDSNWVNHRDHRNTGKSAVDAAYPYARDILFFPEHFKDKAARSHSVTEFLFVDYYDHPDLVGIDVSSTHKIRTKAIASHSSQYSQEDAQDSTDFFTKKKDGRFEIFRYVIAD